MSISTETIVNRALHVSKVIDVFQRTIRHMKKEQVPITSLSLHWAIYWHKPVYIICSSLLLNMQVHLLFIIRFVCFSVSHTCFFDAAKFTIKQFSLVYLLFLLSDNGMNMKWWLKHDPLRLVYITSSPFQDVNLHKNSDNRVVVWWNQIGYT